LGQGEKNKEPVLCSEERKRITKKKTGTLEKKITQEKLREGRSLRMRGEF